MPVSHAKCNYKFIVNQDLSVASIKAVPRCRTEILHSH